MSYKSLVYVFLLAICLYSCSSKSNDNTLEEYDFGVEKYKEPFAFLPSKPSFLVKSLEYTPKWFLSDTITLEKKFVIGFNEDSKRYSSRATLVFLDSLGNVPSGVNVYFNNRHYENNIFTVDSEKLEQEVNIKIKINPELGKRNIGGGILLLSDDIDIINDSNMDDSEILVGTWKAKQEIGWPIMLWLVWFIILCLLLAIVFFVITGLLKLLGGLSFSFSKMRFYSAKNVRVRRRNHINKKENRQEDNKEVKKKKNKEKTEEEEKGVDFFDKIRYVQGRQKGGSVIGRVVERELRRGITCKNNSVYDENRFVNIGRVSGRTIYLEQGFIEILNHPKLLSNFIYKFSLHNVESTVYTDNLGRVIKYIAVIKDGDVNNYRDNTKQTDSLIFKDGEVNYPQVSLERTDRYNDQGGHIIPHIVGGSACLINIYPQAHALNNGEKFKKHENKSRQILKKKGKVTLITILKYNKTCLRPHTIERRHKWYFDNVVFVNKNIKP